MPSIQMVLLELLAAGAALVISLNLSKLKRNWLMFALAIVIGIGVAYLVRVVGLSMLVSDPLTLAMLRLMDTGGWLAIPAALAGAVLGRRKRTAVLLP